MFDSFSEGGVYYGRTALFVIAAIVLTVIAQAI